VQVKIEEIEIRERRHRIERGDETAVADRDGWPRARHRAAGPDRVHQPNPAGGVERGELTGLRVHGGDQQPLTWPVSHGKPGLDDLAPLRRGASRAYRSVFVGVSAITTV